MPLRTSWIRVTIGLLITSGAQSQQTLPIMPLPAHVVAGNGEFLLQKGIELTFTGYTEPRLERARQRFLRVLESETGIRRWPSSDGVSKFVVHTDHASAPVQQLGEDESYRLEITPAQVSLSAPNPLGVLRGLQTFLQLVHATPRGFAVNSVLIEDRPRFPWRGLMIDSGRHFMPLDVMRQNLDAMEAVKLNVLHWHVSEDQGFRIESKAFPELTSMGSDGLFYTQDDVRGIIDYARDRGIRVMPEFEMPSHANSLYVGYPELADGIGSYHLKRKFGEKWGRERKPSEDSSMDPTKESTYDFLDKLFAEMETLFPDAFLHVGGDAEDAVTEWTTNPRVQAYMREHGYKDATALQVYFTARLQKLVVKHHKTMVGWDEVLQPGTPKDVVIQSWRGLDSLATSLKAGNRGILSWGYYLDLNEPASRHYSVDPMSGAIAQLSAEQQKGVLGGETNMWTEYVSPETVDGRIWPRAAAVAERLWSPQENTDLYSMYKRLAILSQHLEYAGLPAKAIREMTFQRLAGYENVEPLKVLAALVEPPRGFPREGTREYTVYTPLNHLSDVIPAEADQGREFRALADRIAKGSAADSDRQLARRWLTAWRDNDTVLQPLLQQSSVMIELTPLSTHLRQASIVGLQALNALESGHRLSSTSKKRLAVELETMKAPVAEMTLSILPGVNALLTAAGNRGS